VVLVLARLEDNGLGAFVVEPTTPGFEVGAPFAVLGLGRGEPAPVRLDSLHLPAGSLVGAPDAGFEVMLTGEAQGR
jgi:alkylation response protein AidB-like acyl-CoA dehydrogenase